jgi:serine/threonine protein phosphatase PrpC
VIKTLAVQVAIATERGTRDTHEDFAGCTPGPASPPNPTHVAAAIADGVGGAKGGRVAAELAVRTFLDAHATPDPLRSAKTTASTAIDAINRWLHAQGHTDATLEGMACTFTALILRGRQAHTVHVGDSRLYRLRDGSLIRQTTDHVPARGAIRNILTRALGAEPGIRIDYAAEPARVHDRYLLCTDAVHGALSETLIHDILSRHDAAQATARTLVQTATDARFGDNATALVLDIVALPEPDQPDLEAEIDSLPIVPVPRSGATIDGLALGTILSDGRYSRVFRAVRAADGLDVVVKFPKPGSEPALRLAFLREFWIAARLGSPWIGEVIETPLAMRSCLYTVMPFYRGETLEQRLRRAPVGRAEGLDIAMKLAKGVAALHRAGVVHRDIKPDNVVLQPDGGLKLIDLGVARLPNIDDFPASAAPGTPSYMAPELHAGALGDVQSDLFALGVTLFRMFTGQYPYGEIEPFSKPRFTRTPASISDLRPDLPSWLDHVLMRMIAAKPADRFADAIEFIFALEHGALHATPRQPRRQSMIERDPLRFWQTAAAILALLLLASVALHTR